jgi:hypothetical protein
LKSENFKTNLSRELNELAVAAGRKRQSEQTGFVHHYYQENESDVEQTIPSVENFLFALSLLQSKTSEQMTEAKELIEKLLHFQDQVSGNFPIYLHEYPQCKDRLIGAHLLPTFYYILKEFKNILGVELREKLIDATIRLISICLVHLEEKNVPYQLGLKIAASAVVFGQMLNDPEIEDKGSKIMSGYLEKGIQPAWFVPTAIADICIALQLVYKSIQESPWRAFAEHLSHTWHKQTCTYVGPALKLYQNGKEPQVSLYNLFLSYFSQQFPEKVLKDAVFHLHGALIRNHEERLLDFEYPLNVQGVLENAKWAIYQAPSYAYSLIEQAALSNPHYANAFHPLFVVWGDQNFVHSFVCQGGNFKNLSYELKNETIVLSGSLSDVFNIEDKEKCREFAFFLDVDPLTKITIHNESSTTFDVAETCLITTPNLKISLNIRMLEGDGQFLGHLMRGNRPSQTLLKGVNRFNAYDWQLFLRTLRRGAHCKMLAQVNIEVC